MKRSDRKSGEDFSDCHSLIDFLEKKGRTGRTQRKEARKPIERGARTNSQRGEKAQTAAWKIVHRRKEGKTNHTDRERKREQESHRSNKSIQPKILNCSFKTLPST
jgi:hypothetical protein